MWCGAECALQMCTHVHVSVNWQNYWPLVILCKSCSIIAMSYFSRKVLFYHLTGGANPPLLCRIPFFVYTWKCCHLILPGWQCARFQQPFILFSSSSADSLPRTAMQCTGNIAPNGFKGRPEPSGAKCNICFHNISCAAMSILAWLTLSSDQSYWK